MFLDFWRDRRWHGDCNDGHRTCEKVLCQDLDADPECIYGGVPVFGGNTDTDADIGLIGSGLILVQKVAVTQT